PDLCVCPLRGNVGTRLKKLETDFEATLLAAAALARLNVSVPNVTFLGPEIMLPAAGQGILALEVRENDSWVQSLLAPINDIPTALCLAAERGFLSKLGSGCQLPVAALAVFEGDDSGEPQMVLKALIASLNGQEIVAGEGAGPIFTPKEAADFGQSLAEELLSRGGQKIMKELEI
ncbi:MAG: hydroxymethylbilane synthase, partial [Candidatus Adiutrix sp.]